MQWTEAVISRGAGSSCPAGSADEMLLPFHLPTPEDGGWDSRVVLHVCRVKSGGVSVAVGKAML